MGESRLLPGGNGISVGLKNGVTGRGKLVLFFELFFRLPTFFQNHLRQLKKRSNTYSKSNVSSSNAGCYSQETETRMS